MNAAALHDIDLKLLRIFAAERLDAIGIGAKERYRPQILIVDDGQFRSGGNQLSQLLGHVDLVSKQGSESFLA